MLCLDADVNLLVFARDCVDVFCCCENFCVIGGDF